MPTNTPQGLLLSGDARNRYDAGDMVDPRGRAKLESFYEIRKLANTLNKSPEVQQAPELAVQPGHLGAVARLDEVSRFLITRYCSEKNPAALEEAEDELRETLGDEGFLTSLTNFFEVFPPEPVRQNEQTVTEYVESRETDGELTTELLAIWLLNENPAVGRVVDLFDAGPLYDDSYDKVIATLQEYFDDAPGFGPEGESLIALLRAHIDRGGDTLDSQLQFLRQFLGHLLPPELLRGLLTTLDVLSEEHKAFRFPGGPGPGPVEPPSFEELDEEPERFSEDLGWMPELVLIAKNVHVWLTQLRRRYDRDIYRLDQIPDEELARLGQAGVSGLWLIGLWERSEASKRIKELSGSPHVVSSAYSIYEYRIADDLGGQEAWDKLRERARQHGVRMAADMVPNHMGITSKWMVEHPERFMRRDDPPYPSYTFNGPDLSDDERIGIFLEDHYFDRSDAAVVFKRVDYQHGSTQYFYHGNDGTSMPWNDTAQLDYLNPDTREAVIQQILDVAKKCSIIRFDAAMTLVKKHIQRLWYPQPGSGGAIPSRAEYGMSKQDFDRVMRREFWTEVVERVAKEAPDTLLLAEAFWMLEGYFVRSLGMHRVYNSAFMNMLSDEDNAGYRRVMKETLEFDPRILRRYVNFMNNPDEETAVAQFGKGDKYFGVATLMATMPGLPMIGHGQLEGFVEKYGMDFNEPRLDESPDEGLVERHQREIFPLLRHRRLFAGVQNFLLYDVHTGNHTVDQNVFAYSNRLGDKSALVVYHNRYAETSGWIRDSVGYRDKSVGADGKIVQKRLAHGLGLSPDPNKFVTFRDHVTGLEYIRSSVELAEKGFFVSLGAYDCHVFLDFREVWDTEDGQYRRLTERLGGRGVSSIVTELRHMELEPLHDLFEDVLTPECVEALAKGDADEELLDALRPKLSALAECAGEFGGIDDVEGYLAEVEHDFEVLVEFEALMDTTPAVTGADAGDTVQTKLIFAGLWAWAIMRPLGGVEPSEESGLKIRSLLDEWSVELVLTRLFRELDVSAAPTTRAIELLRFGLSNQGWLADEETWALAPAELFEALLEDGDARSFLGINRHDDVLWYHGESFDLFMRWLARFGALAQALDEARAGDKVRIAVPEGLKASIEALVKASKDAEYQVDKLLESVEP
ncbi:alpha-amylase [Persicimonas caeni]|uniref:Alpha-amylase n=1 Tax=Persicimonas caeni TaxID=2292766 RepID=A0A4Y6PTE8_PERCE|nr:alpha-amylase family glycosyl hydrolase [Persicimonas caeni]QDG51055.1 alpha-amylase [Persicimonas caeni]QED32276.1 alpha-amylase [Persicimonas caeni]